VSRIIANTGRRGKGKTSLAYWEARELNAGVAVFDTTQSFSIGRIVQSRAELESAIDEDVSPIVFQPQNEALAADFVERSFAEFITPLRNVRRISIVIDESSYLQSPNWIAPALDDELRCGRRREHDVIFTQHRIQDCNGILLSLVSDFRFFQTKHPRDLDKIAEIAGARVAGMVADLRDFEFLGYSVERESAYVHCRPDVWRVAIAAPAPENFPQMQQPESAEVVH
jgi:hypothetical protein